MTVAQKQFLRVVPIAILLFIGMLSSRFSGLREAMSGKAAQPVGVPGPPPKPFDAELTPAQIATQSRILGIVEQSLDADEEFVRAAEAFYRDERLKPQPEARRKKDEQVNEAIENINLKQWDLDNLRLDVLSDTERARVSAASARRMALCGAIDPVPSARKAPGESKTDAGTTTGAAGDTKK